MLIAVDAAALHARRYGSSGGGTATAQREARGVAGPAGGGGGGGRSVQPGDSEAQAQPAVAAWPTMPQVPLHVQCLQAKRCRQRSDVAPSYTTARTFVDHPSASHQQLAGHGSMLRVILTVLLQVDFAPTLAALLGVPTPYASIGRVSRGLWHLRGCSADSDAQSCRQRYVATLQANAWQVRLRMLMQIP